MTLSLPALPTLRVFRRLGGPRRPSRAERRILDALDCELTSGLEIVRAGAARRGAVYVHLDRMEDEGWVTSERVSESGRRTYAITYAGLLALDR